jgi:hypothetical protein
MVELANSKRHLFVTKNLEIVSYGGDPTCTNLHHVLIKLEKGGYGPFTMDEAKLKVVELARKAMQGALDNLARTTRIVDSRIDQIERMDDDYFLGFKETK